MIYVSSSTLPFKIGEYVENNGYLPSFDNIEFGMGFISRSNALFCCDKAVKEGKKVLIHNYFPPPTDPFVLNLASTNQTILEKSLNICKEAIDISARLASPFYSVHSGFAVDPDVRDLGGEMLHLRRSSLNKIYEIFLASVEILADFAEQHGVKLLLENNPMDKRNVINGCNELFLLCDIDDFLQFGQDFTHPNIGILLDVGHLKVSAASLGFNKYKAMEAIANKIEAFHLHDNDGFVDQHLPFGKNAWFLDMLSEFKNKAVFILESNRITVREIKAQEEIISALLD